MKNFKERVLPGFLILFFTALAFRSYFMPVFDSLETWEFAWYGLMAGAFLTIGCYPLKTVWLRLLAFFIGVQVGVDIIFGLGYAARWIYLVSAVMGLGLFGYCLFSRRRVDCSAFPSS